jgi:uncharacterized protein (DUF433 family)
LATEGTEVTEKKGENGKWEVRRSPSKSKRKHQESYSLLCVLCALCGSPSFLAVEAGMTFERITIDPDKMAGVPCIRDLRMPVATVVAMVAEGMTDDEILAAHPDLERDDIREALRYAAEAVKE